MSMSRRTPTRRSLPDFDALLREAEARARSKPRFQPGRAYQETLWSPSWLREHTVSGYELAAARGAIAAEMAATGRWTDAMGVKRPACPIDAVLAADLRRLAQSLGSGPADAASSPALLKLIMNPPVKSGQGCLDKCDGDAVRTNNGGDDSTYSDGPVAGRGAGRHTAPPPPPPPPPTGGEEGGSPTGRIGSTGASPSPSPHTQSADSGAAGLDPESIRTGEVCFVGPAGTGKTRAILEWLVERCRRRPNIRVLVCRDFRDGHTQSTMVTLEKEVFDPEEFGDAVSNKPIRWHTGEQAYLFANGSEMVIKGLRDSRGIYSTQYDHVLVNEAGSPNIDEEDYDQLLRAKRNNHDDISLLLSDLNPEYEMHWLHQRCDEGATTEVVTAHTDNPAVSGAYLHDLSSMRDTQSRDRLYLGKRISSVKGSYYQDAMNEAREAGRIRPILPQRGLVTHTAWDLGRSDYTAIWLFQRVLNEWHFIDYYESHLEELDHYWGVLETIRQELRLTYGTHCLPHDATHRTLASRGETVQSQLWNLGMVGEVVVPQTPLHVQHFMVRQALATSYFDNSRWVQPERHHRHRRGVRFGVQRLLTYRAAQDDRLSVLRPHPEHDLASHGASAFATGILAAPTSRSGPPARVVRDEVDYLPNTRAGESPTEGYRRVRR